MYFLCIYEFSVNKLKDLLELSVKSAENSKTVEMEDKDKCFLKKCMCRK